MAQGEDERRRKRISDVCLSARAYRVVVSTSFAGWGLILIAVFCTGRFQVWVERDGLLVIAQTTAGLAAVSLAMLAYLQQAESRDRYLKLLLASLTFVFLLATLTGWIAALTIGPSGHDLRALTIRFLAMGVLCVVVGVSGSTLARHPKRRGGPSKLRLRLAGAFDYSFSVSPVCAFGLWSNQASFCGTALTLAIGGALYLICSVVGLLITVWRATSHRQDLEERILRTVRDLRSLHQQGERGPEPVTLDFLRNSLWSNDEILGEAVDVLCGADQLVRLDYRSFYIIEVEDWLRCVTEIRSFDIVVTGGKEGAFPWDGIAKSLGDRLRLPDQVISHYFKERIIEFLEKNFTSVDARVDCKDFKVYFETSHLTRPKLSNLAERVRRRREENRRSYYTSDSYEEELGEEILKYYSSLPSKDYTLCRVVGVAARGMMERP